MYVRCVLCYSVLLVRDKQCRIVASVWKKELAGKKEHADAMFYEGCSSPPLLALCRRILHRLTVSFTDLFQGDEGASQFLAKTLTTLGALQITDIPTKPDTCFYGLLECMTEDTGKTSVVTLKDGSQRSPSQQDCRAAGWDDVSI